VLKSKINLIQDTGIHTTPIHPVTPHSHTPHSLHSLQTLTTVEIRVCPQTRLAVPSVIPTDHNLGKAEIETKRTMG